jgi:hypothetical protein
MSRRDHRGYSGASAREEDFDRIGREQTSSSGDHAVSFGLVGNWRGQVLLSMGGGKIGSSGGSSSGSNLRSVRRAQTAAIGLSDDENLFSPSPSSTALLRHDLNVNFAITRHYSPSHYDDAVYLPCLLNASVIRSITILLNLFIILEERRLGIMGSSSATTPISRSVVLCSSFFMTCQVSLFRVSSGFEEYVRSPTASKRFQ